MRRAFRRRGPLNGAISDIRFDVIDLMTVNHLPLARRMRVDQHLVLAGCSSPIGDVFVSFRFRYACPATFDLVRKELVVKVIGRGHCPGKDKRAQHPTHQVDSYASSRRIRLKALLDGPDHPLETLGEHLSDGLWLPRNISGECRRWTRPAGRI